MTPRVLVLGTLLFAAGCLAQTAPAELFGLVQDQSGLPVRNARVSAEDQATSARYSTLSTGRGEYHLVGLPAGAYVLTVEQPGFRTSRQSGIVLRAGMRAWIDV